ncbi:MAG TPA: cupin domain-containing protein [Solirubrobacteraceae bacterium]|nr:cupin domain-containing protein [Solirubrobacteraceae bacterium]
MRRVSTTDPEFTYDPGDPEGFRSGMFRIGPQAGATRTGATVYELPPGQAVCPYHYEYGEEEWVLVLAGRPTLRTPEGEARLGPGDLAFFPTGPDGAHQLRNDADEAARLLMFSNVVYPTATAYPDSDKVGVWTGHEAEDVMVPRSAEVPYFHGETG